MIRLRVFITGSVQGVGFRPFIWRRATGFGLHGWVRNDSSGVTIEVQGSKGQADAFLAGLAQSAPPLARIDSVEVLAVSLESESSFVIHESAGDARASTPISPDVAVCADCLREMNDPTDRRYGYPFINCTNCGPRFTIVEDIPYDRMTTTMKSFVMCPQCQAEYDDPSNRRFHAQPNACPDCGPGIWFVDVRSGDTAGASSSTAIRRTDLTIAAVCSAIEQGQIVAIKGVGGFHLACDPRNSAAIATLRQRKGRVDKPFALMVQDIEVAQAFAKVTEHECHLLESWPRPIVLLKKRTDSPWNAMLQAVAPGNDYVGVMLPYAPLHHLLVREQLLLVMTSGNLSDEPIVRTNEEAVSRLRPLADSFLFHNREINAVCDDSVVRSVSGEVLPIRRSRGYSPMPVRLAEDGPSILAVGGELKATFCVTKGRYAYLSQHIGDMGNVETLQAMQRNVEHFLRLFRIQIEAIAADLHPGYLSTRWAQQYANALGVPLIGIQHHFAHGVSLFAEGGQQPTDPGIICCFDGTGYGSDGAIWGGEFLTASYLQFERSAHLKYVSLPGGDASIKRPYRAALACLWSHGIDWDRSLPCVRACGEDELRVLKRQLEKSINCTATSSMGRLFDAVASLIGIRHEVTYEAQAAMELEACAGERIDQADRSAYRFEITRGPVWQVDTSLLWRQVCQDVLAGVDRGMVAARFHHAVANMVTDVCCRIRAETALATVGLTGGVFQNVLLLELTRRSLVENGFAVLTHAIVPPNDGGLALGQSAAARAMLSRQGPESRPAAGQTPGLSR